MPSRARHSRSRERPATIASSLERPTRKVLAPAVPGAFLTILSSIGLFCDTAFKQLNTRCLNCSWRGAGLGATSSVPRTAAGRRLASGGSLLFSDQPQRRPLSVSRIGLSRSDRDRPSSGVADRLFQTPHRSSGGGGSLLGLPPLGVGGLSASSSSLSSASARKVLSRHTGELQRQLTALQVSPLLCVELSSHSPEILLAGLGQLELAARTSAASTVELTGALLELPCTASSQHGTVQLVVNEMYSQY